jgi:hypothetical protein
VPARAKGAEGSESTQRAKENVVQKCKRAVSWSASEPVPDDTTLQFVSQVKGLWRSIAWGLRVSPDLVMQLKRETGGWIDSLCKKLQLGILMFKPNRQAVRYGTDPKLWITLVQLSNGLVHPGIAGSQFIDRISHPKHELAPHKLTFQIDETEADGDCFFHSCLREKVDAQVSAAYRQGILEVLEQYKVKQIELFDPNHMGARGPFVDMRAYQLMATSLGTPVVVLHGGPSDREGEHTRTFHANGADRGDAKAVLRVSTFLPFAATWTAPHSGWRFVHYNGSDHFSRVTLERSAFTAGLAALLRSSYHVTENVEEGWIKGRSCVERFR